MHTRVAPACTPEGLSSHERLLDAGRDLGGLRVGVHDPIRASIGLLAGSQERSQPLLERGWVWLEQGSHGQLLGR
jgi:hypothetical protein